MKTSYGGAALEELSFKVLPQPKQVRRCLSWRVQVLTSTLSCFARHIFHRPRQIRNSAPRFFHHTKRKLLKNLVMFCFLSIIQFIPVQLVVLILYQLFINHNLYSAQIQNQLSRAQASKRRPFRIWKAAVRVP